MRAYLNGDERIVKVKRCPAGLYVITNLGVAQNAVGSKETLQSFLDQWEPGHDMLPVIVQDEAAVAFDECPLKTPCITGLCKRCKKE